MVAPPHYNLWRPFRRQDISSWVRWSSNIHDPDPYIGVFAYLIFQERGIADRNVQQAQQTRDELRRAISLSIADEIEKLDWLKKSRPVTAGGICAAARDADLGGHAELNRRDA